MGVLQRQLYEKVGNFMSNNKLDGLGNIDRIDYCIIFIIYCYIYGTFSTFDVNNCCRSHFKPHFTCKHQLLKLKGPAVQVQKVPKIQGNLRV